MIVPFPEIQLPLLDAVHMLLFFGFVAFAAFIACVVMLEEGRIAMGSIMFMIGIVSALLMKSQSETYYLRHKVQSGQSVTVELISPDTEHTQFFVPSQYYGIEDVLGHQ